MFTIDQIKAAHSKVRSGADFPAYIHEINLLGVTGYTTFIEDGHVDYSGENHFAVSSPAKYEPIKVSDVADATTFKAVLKVHQHGQSDYLTFIRQSAEAGVQKWIVNMSAMTCTYYDKAGKEMLEEVIPSIAT